MAVVLGVGQGVAVEQGVFGLLPLAARDLGVAVGIRVGAASGVAVGQTAKPLWCWMMGK